MWTTSFKDPTSVDHHPTNFEYLLMTGSASFFDQFLKRRHLTRLQSVYAHLVDHRVNLLWQRIFSPYPILP